MPNTAANHGFGLGSLTERSLWLVAQVGYTAADRLDMID